MSKSERLEISILRSKKYSMREIARATDRSPNTISAELRRNRVCGTYNPQRAHHKAYVRKKYARFQWKKLNQDKELKGFIVSCLKRHWSPSEIAGHMKREKLSFYVSKNSIYRWLYSTQGSRYCRYLYSKRYTKKKRVKKTERVMIPNRAGIQERMAGANNRSRYGHFECDTIVSGKHGSGAVSVLIDRKSRYVILNKLSTLAPSEHARVLTTTLGELSVRSVTFDNGIENRGHQELGIPTFFCDPYSSWQKGSVENVNKMVRRYIPKGSDISKVSEEKIKEIESIINKKPRKILGYRSAYDVMMERELLTE